MTKRQTIAQKAINSLQDDLDGFCLSAMAAGVPLSEFVLTQAEINVDDTSLRATLTRQVGFRRYGFDRGVSK